MIGFKTKEIERDFKAGVPDTDPRIVAVILSLDLTFPEQNFVLTCGHRTPKENEGVGGVRVSAHCQMPLAAFDIRRRNIPMPIITKMENYLQFWWGDLFDLVIKPDHLHLEIDRPFWKLNIKRFNTPKRKAEDNRIFYPDT